MNTVLDNQDLDLLTKEASLWESAVGILVERITSLSKEAKEDLVELLTELKRPVSEEERAEIEQTLREILAPRLLGKILPLDPSAAGTAALAKRSERIGARIRRYREERGWTQEELAKRSGLPQSHVSRLEVGRHSPSSMTLSRLAKALKVPVTKLDEAQRVSLR